MADKSLDSPGKYLIAIVGDRTVEENVVDTFQYNGQVYKLSITCDLKKLLNGKNDWPGAP